MASAAEVVGLFGVALRAFLIADNLCPSDLWRRDERSDLRRRIR
jgi:hypothetical protein